MTHTDPLTLETEIRSLLDRPPSAADAARAVVEQTLTDGYAHALQLDGRRLRTEARLRELVRDGDTRATADEAIRELAEVDAELARLRALLSSLRAHAL